MTLVEDVARHYEQLLAEHYTWMTGKSFADKVDEQRTMLDSIGFVRGVHGTAVDLGCGPGFQSIALAQLGYSRVVAVDTSRALLDELRSYIGDLPVHAMHADLRAIERLVAPASAELIVCMGDTLTHLQSRTDVSALLAATYRALVPGDSLVLAFRDLSRPLTGLDRFIPVRGDADKFMMCVLDYEPETVIVSDLIHERDQGGWKLRKSSYRKLRIGAASLRNELVELGFSISRDEPAGGLHVIVAET